MIDYETLPTTAEIAPLSLPLLLPSVGDALVVLAHELRNPLSLIRSDLWLLGRNLPENTEAADTCIRIDRQVEQLAALVKDLVSIARTGFAEAAAEPLPVDLRALLTTLTAALRVDAEGSGLTIALDMADERLTVSGDGVRLMQALTNVLANAVKYTDPGGRIDVVARRIREQIVIRVRDTGRGIPEDLLDAVFNPFVRVLPGEVQGLGVGLSVARWAIETHGGTLTATSDGAGSGSEFVIRLPAPR